MQVKKILIPVDGDEADEEAIRLACKLSKLYKSQLFAIYVVTMGRTLPVEAELKPETENAEKILNHMKELAEADSCKLQVKVMQRREQGAAVIEAAKELEIDLIVMGINYMQRFGQYSLGDTVPYILKNAPCRVILYQQHNQQLPSQ